MIVDGYNCVDRRRFEHRLRFGFNRMAEGDGATSVMAEIDKSIGLLISVESESVDDNG